MMKSKKLAIGLLLMLSVVVTTGSFAYWANSIAGDSDVVAASVTIGTGNDVTTTITVADLADTSALIPTDYGVAGTDDTAELTLPVAWDADLGGADGATGTLSVVLDSYTLGTLTEDEIDAMFSITVTSGAGAITEGISQDVVITIVFGTEPASKLIYDEVDLGTLAMSFTFSVVPD